MRSYSNKNLETSHFCEEWKWTKDLRETLRILDNWNKNQNVTNLIHFWPSQILLKKKAYAAWLLMVGPKFLHLLVFIFTSHCTKS